MRRIRKRHALGVAVLAALVASWLHPWQGITLVLIYVGLAVLRRLRSALALAVPAIAAGLPLIYYYLLSHHDSAWKLASHYEVISRLPSAAERLTPSSCRRKALRRTSPI